MLIFQEVFLKTIFLQHTHLPDIVLNGRQLLYQLQLSYMRRWTV